MTGTVKEKAKKGRQVTGERNVSMEVKWGKRNRIFLSTLLYEFGAWMWNEAQQLQIRAVELNLMISECGVSGWDGENDESMYERFNMVEWFNE